MLLHDLEKRQLIVPPTYLVTNTHYLCRMGSHAYGVSTDNSDLDLYGVCIPPRDYIFPPNYIYGFDNRDLTFHCWQKHDIKDPTANRGNGVRYDFSIYNIVNYFKLAMENNPNVIDSFFVRRESITHITQAFENVRENRKLFLHKGVVNKLKGYAYSQLQKAKNSASFLNDIYKFEDDHGIDHRIIYEDAKKLSLPPKGMKDYMMLWEMGLNKTKRFESQKIYGFDLKFCYHIYRLADQAEYILIHHDLDLMESGRVEKMKAIRRGDIKFEEIVKMFSDYESRLSNMVATSTLRETPPIREIRALLLTTLESHYGSLSNFINDDDGPQLALNEIRGVLRKYGL